MRRYPFLIALTLVGLLSGIVVAYLYPDRFTSTATIAASPQQVTEQYVPGAPAIDVALSVRSHAQTVLSRATLTMLITSLDLYPSARAKFPMQDVIEMLRKDVVLKPQPDQTVSIAFSYSDRYKAQQVVSEISARLIEMAASTAATSFQGMHVLLEDQANTAAERWQSLRNELQRAGKADERVTLDCELARKEYIELRARLSTITLAESATKRGLTSQLEMRDPASLPQKADSRRAATVGIGAACGLIAGLLVEVGRRVHRRPQPRLVPA